MLLALSAAAIAGCGDNDDDGGPRRPVSCDVASASAVISVGQTIEGQLTTSDCLLDDDTPADLYRLTLNTARTIQIDMSSGSFDTYLVLFNASGGVPIDENDDIAFPSNLNSRIVRTLPAGTYIIGANTVEPDDLGSYTLRVQ
jgi:hypothetical protein